MTEYYKFKAIYKFISIIYDFVFEVEYEFPYYGFDENAFAESATKFNKITLLHIFVISTLCGYYNEDFHDNSDCYDEEKLEWWKNIMVEYGVQLKHPNFDFENDNDKIDKWYERNSDSFLDFFCIISDEIVHILFGDMAFLVKFNQRMSYIIENYNKEHTHDKIPFLKNCMKEDGTIQRCDIPSWVKKAVFYRDYGHCVFCGCDLTNTISTLPNINYDHIVPLHKYGSNDPCNIQLCCEKCNKTKGGNELFPKYKYMKRW